MRERRRGTTVHTRGNRRLFPAIVVLLLVGMGVLMFWSSRLENQTWDESLHLTAGYVYWKLGDFHLNPEHPPLGKLLSAAPLLLLNLRIPLEHESWKAGDVVLFGAVFLYRNLTDPDTLLLLGRLPTMGLALLLGGVLAFWGRRHFGLWPALLALFLYVSDPNLIAHGRYVTTDMIATLFFFLTVVTWARFLETKRLRDLIWAGAVLGLALASKFSMVILLLLLPLLYGIRWWQTPRRFSWKHFVVSGAATVSLAAFIVLMVYGPATTEAFTTPGQAPLSEQVHRSNLVGEVLYWTGKILHVPPHPYLLGLDAVALHNQGGHRSYLLGKISEKGHWYYFPVAFAVKTPTAVLLLLLLSLGASLVFVRGGDRIRRLRTAPFAWIVVTVSPLCYFLFAMSSNLNLGLRHILPVYPFLFLLVSAVLFREPVARWAMAVAVLLVCLQIYEHVRIAPHYLAFFNTPAGGAVRGPDYLVDSNIDWGQDARKLGLYMKRHGIGQVRLSYFGVTDLDYYGVFHRNLMPEWSGRDAADINAVVAISVTNLKGIYTGDDYGWFQRREPDTRIGYSIYVYDLRKQGGAIAGGTLR